MRTLFTIIFTIMIGLFLNAQVLITNDFEAYTVGGKLVQQAGAPWTTWGNAPGGPEDAVIADAEHVSGAKSVKFVSDNDVVLKFGDKTEGRYEYSFQIKPIAGKNAYFNVLMHFDGSNSKWGIQIYYPGDGKGYVDAGKSKSAFFNYTNNTWMPFKLVVDLEDDFATLYLNTVEVVSYKWSLGAQGEGGPKKIAAGNFYGWKEGRPAEYYVDDVKFEKMPTFTAPQNLTATLQGTKDIKLQWTAPTSGTPASYSIMRDGEIIKTGVTGTTFTDVNVYPGNHKYAVRAAFTYSGYSPSSNEASATIEGGVDRELVLFEIGTGVWCQYCPGAAMGAADLEANGKKVAILKYHAANGDPYEIPAGIARLQYYEIQYFPTTMVDGKIEVSGGSANTSMYPSYLPVYEKRIEIPATMALNLDMTAVSPGNYKANVTLEKKHDYFNNDVFIFGALTESHIAHAWQGQSEVNNVVRAMYPATGTGDIVTFPSGSNKVTFNYEISTAGFNKDNCEFVVFAQHMPTKEIIQVAKKAIKSVSVDAKQNISFNVYPNPTSSVLNIETSSAQPITYTITNLQGKVMVPTTVLNEKTDIDVSKWTTGIYILKTNTGTVKKFSVITK